MIQSGAKVTPQRPPYIYGEILSRSVYAEKYDLPGVGTFLSQGIVVGAFFSFLLPLMGMLSHPENGYNFLLIAWLPYFLAVGMAFGALEAIGLWACSYIAGHQLHPLARAVLVIAILAVLLFGYGYFFLDAPTDQNASLQDYLPVIALYIASAAVFGLVGGSRFKPLDELLRGSQSTSLRVPAALTGFVLRVLVVYSLMDVILMVIWFSQSDFHRREFGFVAVALVHLIAATAIVFVRMPFWLLLPLALIINFPVGLLITEVFTEEQDVERYFVITYLALWAAFLLCRASVAPAALSFIKKELRYYLID